MTTFARHWLLAMLLPALLMAGGCDVELGSGGDSDSDNEPGSAIASAAPVPLRVMSYNIWHGRGPDGVIDLDRQAAVISSQMPDLVAIQEVDNLTTRSSGVDQAAELAALAGMPYYLFGRAIDFQGGEFGVAILSRYPLRFSGVELLPVTGGLEQRIALWLEVEVPDIGPVLVANTHLEAYFIEQDRTAQATRLVELFGTATLTPAGTAMPETVILLGDFNADSGTPAIDLLEAEFDDAYVGAPEFSFPSDVPTNAYDKIFINKDSPLEAVQSWVLDDSVASDHRPVIVDFEFLPAT